MRKCTRRLSARRGRMSFTMIFRKGFIKILTGIFSIFAGLTLNMSTFRPTAIRLPRIVGILLIVFTFDVALASTCCVTAMDCEPVESKMPNGADCPQDNDSSEYPSHNTCCLSCVVTIPVSQFPELNTVVHFFHSPLVYLNPSTGLEPPYRPPIQRLL